MRPLYDLVRNARIDAVVTKLRAQLASTGISITEAKQCGTSPDPAVFIEFEGPRHLTRVTAWESGRCDAEVLRIADCGQVAYLHQQIESEDAYMGVIMEALRRMEADVE